MNVVIYVYIRYSILKMGKIGKTNELELRKTVNNLIKWNYRLFGALV